MKTAKAHNDQLTGQAETLKPSGPDLEKLRRSLDETLESETDESTIKWLEDQRKAHPVIVLKRTPITREWCEGRAGFFTSTDLHWMAIIDSCIKIVGDNDGGVLVLLLEYMPVILLISTVEEVELLISLLKPKIIDFTFMIETKGE